MVPLMDDLRLCSVRTLDEMDRRFCFEIFSVHASCILQADSEASRQAWTEAMRSTINSAYRDSQVLDRRAQGSEVSAPGTEGRDPYAEGQRVLEQSLRVAGNQRCCDCGKADPRWASINLGITLCIECSGIHRGLGVHQSKVRSLTLDTWEPELLKLLCALGNDTVNQIYEAETEHSGLTKPTAESSRQEKEQWIEAKYVEKKFLKKNPAAADQVPDDPAEMSGAVSPSHRLYAAAAVGDLPAMCQALALGANVNWTNSEESRTSPLIAAARRGSLTACEYLLQNGANISYRDASGQGPLHVATRAGHTGPVCLLLKRGANQYAVDERGQDPLSIAVATANADIVTL
ncbi:arf-GAP with coiled-coil, ANK repeat and PH domain-containing protein 2-like [Rhincodon typus]|uniref:arf-GAP with coiled-coil, ANK repeat and PH domain-containing protein 2-like n=1 Tax=Rhincodon typus TaxID=259920 RepID=UPI0020303EE4|nr:arf-GAP with coiled-coil, ANK repeat and PH domain-containing protein 2-like [Rhincodon typus]